MDFAVSINYLLLYGHNDNGYYFIVIDKKTGASENVKTNLRIDKLINYNENEALMHVSSDLSNDSYFTSYNMNDGSFGLQYKSNVNSIISATWDNAGNNIIFSNYDNVTKTYYLKSLNIENGLISTINMSGAEDSSNTNFNNISVSSNILV